MYRAGCFRDITAIIHGCFTFFDQIQQSKICWQGSDAITRCWEGGASPTDRTLYSSAWYKRLFLLGSKPITDALQAESMSASQDFRLLGLVELLSTNCAGHLGHLTRHNSSFDFSESKNLVDEKQLLIKLFVSLPS